MPRFDGTKLLIVDDHADGLALLVEIFECAGADVRAARNTAGALAHLERFTPDALLTNIGLPEEDGIALFHQVRARMAFMGRKIPGVAITGYCMPAQRVQVLEAGFAAQIDKPSTPAAVMRVVASVLTP